MAASTTTSYQWTQSLRDVFVTISVIDALDVHTSFTSSSFTVTCTVAGVLRESSLELFDLICPEQSEFLWTSRSVRLRLRKGSSPDARPRYWTRLTQLSKKFSHVTVNWDNWKEEEELTSQADEDEQGKQLAKAFGFKMENGVSISGAGNPDVIAAMQRELLLAAKNVE